MLSSGFVKVLAGRGVDAPWARLCDAAKIITDAKTIFNMNRRVLFAGTLEGVPGFWEIDYISVGFQFTDPLDE